MEPILAQIMLFAGNFAPRGWAFCDGQLLLIEEHNALFSLLGVTYGGDGRKNFALPDLRGRVPMHAGHGHDLTPRQIGRNYGAESVSLSVDQLPVHSHELRVANATADSAGDTGGSFGQADIYASTAPAMVALNAQTIAPAGSGQAHDNMQPTLCISYIIALQGAFPSRN